MQCIAHDDVNHLHIFQDSFDVHDVASAMTVEDTPSAPVSPPAAAAVGDDRPDSPKDGARVVNGKFVWRPPPEEAMSICGRERVLCCDVCPVSGFANELGLKAHQIRLHLNPSHLSDEDRSLAGPAAAAARAAENGDAEGGVYRCHLCLRLCEEKVNLLP